MKVRVPCGFSPSRPTPRNASPHPMREGMARWAGPKNISKNHTISGCRIYQGRTGVLAALAEMGGRFRYMRYLPRQRGSYGGIRVQLWGARQYLMYEIGRLVGEKTTADKFPEAKKAAVRRSRSVLGGMFAEQLAPVSPQLPLQPHRGEIHRRTNRLSRLQRHGRAAHRGSHLRRSKIRISAPQPQRAQPQRRDRKQTCPLARVPRPRSPHELPRHRTRTRALTRG